MKRDEVFKFLEINLGLVICSIGISCFFWPTGFITGGASGLSILLEQLIPKISNVVFLYIINISLLVISLPILGKNYFLKTLYATLMLPTFVALAEFIIKATGLYDTLAGLESWLIVCFGAVIMGVGQGMSLRANGSTGGLDVIGSIAFKCLHLPYSISNSVINSLIIIAGMIVTGLEKGLMAVVFMILVGFILDTVVFGGVGKRAVFIKSDKTEEVRNMITSLLHRGCTIINCEGGYYHIEGQMLICVCLAKEYVMLRGLLDQIDPNAFTFMTKASEVRGFGFSKDVLKRKEEIQALKEEENDFK